MKRRKYTIMGKIPVETLDVNELKNHEINILESGDSVKLQVKHEDGTVVDVTGGGGSSTGGGETFPIEFYVSYTGGSGYSSYVPKSLSAEKSLKNQLDELEKTMQEVFTEAGRGGELPELLMASLKLMNNARGISYDFNSILNKEVEFSEVKRNLLESILPGHSDIPSIVFIWGDPTDENNKVIASLDGEFNFENNQFSTIYTDENGDYAGRRDDFYGVCFLGKLYPIKTN